MIINMLINIFYVLIDNYKDTVTVMMIKNLNNYKFHFHLDHRNYLTF